MPEGTVFYTYALEKKKDSNRIKYIQTAILGKETKSCFTWFTIDHIPSTDANLDFQHPTLGAALQPTK